MSTVRIRSTVWFATGAVLALLAMLVVTEAWRVDAAPGDKDTTFVSMTACRLIDTRPPPDRVGPHSTWATEDTKTVQATGTNGQCTIPSDAVAVSMKVFALNATSPGFITIWDSGPLPLASALNPSPGGIVFSAATTPLSPTGSFEVFNKIGNVDIIMDVTGYHTKSSLQEISSRLLALEASQPFVKYTRGADFPAFGTNFTSLAQVSITAPVAGRVVVDVAGTAFEDRAGDDVRCAIDSRVPTFDAFEDLIWEASGATTGSTAGEGDGGVIAGTRVFPIAANTTKTFHFSCKNTGVVGTSNMTAPTIVATFIAN